ncbi:hypothetical protein [Phaeobacter phage MD18]|nr:hypothetical protein [Phaeobacter phage MD18]
MIEPIYIYRPVTAIGSAILMDYAYRIGIENPVLDMHVTLAYSSSPVDWDKPEFQMDPRPLTVSGGSRSLTKFDGGAIVLELESRALSQRWAQFVMAGASWDYTDYRPHVTLGYDDTFPIEGKPVMMGEIPFSAEAREWLNTEFVPETA